MQKNLDHEISDRRGRSNFDKNWKFSFGHPSDTNKDFRHGTRYFSYFAKAGYGDGPAASDFDDRAWRTLDLPHDWAVELPLSSKGSHSHGYQTLGHQFPQTSLAWYRKQFFIPEADLGQRIWLEFDGIFRDSQIWVNGFYCGREESGYLGCRYDISEYLHYGAENTVAVRVDARMEEGWFYEGAGIYRHVWLAKYDPVHIPQDATWVRYTLEGLLPSTANGLAHEDVGGGGIARAEAVKLTVQTSIINSGSTKARFSLEQTVFAPALSASEGLPVCQGDGSDKGFPLARVETPWQDLEPAEERELSLVLEFDNPVLWDLENPALHMLRSVLKVEGASGGIPLPGSEEKRLVLSASLSGERVAQVEELSFGLRELGFDADSGFWLNGRQVKLVGSNNHQDHAGLGVALPDAVQDYRLRRLKSFGSNAYRCSHNPPTPELLDACDRLGMLVIDENRLMGCTDQLLGQVKRMIHRDRNHPSVILWSLGNEEWQIEGNIQGARLAQHMQNYAKKIDPDRRYTLAISGGWGWGISTVLDVMGYNYISHGSTDEQHKLFPQQPGVGTEETTTQGTRGVYYDNPDRSWLAPIENGTSGFNAEIGWRYYAEREYLAGLFYWTGFDYRGEPVPLEWPAVLSQFGIMDNCGFPKNSYWYLRAWWLRAPLVKILPSWNWEGFEGKEIRVWVYSNADEVDLFLNGKSLGKKALPRQDHLEWLVPYEAGRLEAKAWKDGKPWASDAVETCGPVQKIKLEIDPDCIAWDGKIFQGADKRRIALVQVSALDLQNRAHPESDALIHFKVEGSGKILGVGNGDPGSHEADVYCEAYHEYLPEAWCVSELSAQSEMPSASELEFSASCSGPSCAAGPLQARTNAFDTNWAPAFITIPWNIDVKTLPKPGPGAWYRSKLCLDCKNDEALYTLYVKTWAEKLWIWVNGTLVLRAARANPKGLEASVPASCLREGPNTVAMFASGLGDEAIRFPENFSPLSLGQRIPAEAWKRRLFKGLAQVIVELGDGPCTLKASSSGLEEASLELLKLS